jgi:hypothetical protein
MAAPTPTEIFGPGFAVDTTTDTITFKYAGNVSAVHDFVMLEDASVADARTVIYGILSRLTAWQNDLPLLNRPETMRVTSGGSVVTASGITFIQRNFNVVFQADLNALELLPEE